MLHSFHENPEHFSLNVRKWKKLKFFNFLCILSKWRRRMQFWESYRLFPTHGGKFFAHFPKKTKKTLKSFSKEPFHFRAFRLKYWKEFWQTRQIRFDKWSKFLYQCPKTVKVLIITPKFRFSSSCYHGNVECIFDKVAWNFSSTKGQKLNS